MNSREVALVSTAAAVFGALASAVACRFFFFNPKRQRPQFDLSTNDALFNNGGGHSQCPFDPSKRKGFLSWDDYFMAIAFLSAERSKDPNRQVGACLVSQNGVILGIGYNGFPRGCSDDKLPWAKKSKTSNPLETKYPYVCHAEVNAILNTNHASASGQAYDSCPQGAAQLVEDLGFEDTFRVFIPSMFPGTWRLGTRLYVTMFPCNECAKVIIQSGVSEVVYFIEKRMNNSVAYVASHKLLAMAGVKVRKHQPLLSQILIKFEDSRS